MPIVETALYGGFLPGVLALVFLLAAWRFAAAGLSRVFSFIGIAAAFLTGFVILMGLPPLPAIDVSQWIAWLVLLTAVAGVVYSYLQLNYAGKLAIHAAQSLLLAVLILNPFNEYLWENQHVSIWIAGVTLFCIFLFHVLEQQLRREEPRRNLFVVAFAAVVSVPVFMNSGSIKLLQISILLSAILGATWFASVVIRRMRPQDIVVPFVSTILTPLLIAGNRYASLPSLSVAFLMAAFLAPWLIRWPGQRTRPWTVFTLRILLVLIFSLLALYQTFDFSPTETGYDAYGY